MAGVSEGNATFEAGDTIDGGAGQDTLRLVGTNNIFGFFDAGTDVENVEEVYARFTVEGELDVSDNKDVEQVWVDGGDITQREDADGNPIGDLETEIRLKATQTAGIKGEVNDFDAAGGDPGPATLTFNHQSVDGADDSATIALDDADTSTLTAVNIGAGLETLTLSVSGENEAYNLNEGGTLKTLNIEGSGDFEGGIATGAAGNLETVAAGDATGDLTLNLSEEGDRDLDVTTGSGDDAVGVLFNSLSTDATGDANDTFDLGSGDDVLGFADAVDIDAAAEAAVLDGVTNVEALAFFDTDDGPGGSYNVDVSLLSQSKFYLDTLAGGAITEATEGDEFVLSSEDSGDNEITMKQGEQVLDLAVEADGDDAASGTVIANDASTINLASVGEEGVDDVVADANGLALNADDNAVVNVTGDQDLDLAVSANTEDSGLTVDASDFTGDLDVSGTADVADTIIGGSGDDAISGGAIVTDISGGAIVTQFTVTFAGDAAGADEIAFDGGDVTLTGGDDATAIAAAVDGGTYTNWSTAQAGASVTFTATSATGEEISAADFTITDTGGDGAPTIESVTTTLVADGAADVLTGGDGEDAFVVATAVPATSAAADEITDFVSGTDTIEFGSITVEGSSDAYSEGTSAVEDFDAALAAANEAFAADAADDLFYNAQQVEDDTFVFGASDGGDSADQVVKLTGVSLDGIAAGDIVGAIDALEFA